MSRTEVLLRDKNVLAGLIFLLIAGTYGYAAFRLPLGSTLRMGPGYFPLMLTGMLGLLGLLSVVNGFRTASPETGVSGFVWSRVALVCGAALFFALCLDGLGLPLAVFGTVLIAAMASQRFRLVEGLLLALAVAVASWVLFHVLLGLSFRMFGSWFG
ncbi:tripartite tricarboxylate transporter TctB family protein [Devosia sp. Root635]|uniref:tripartite tricarboxylate transporter TctB family protein n=1 Tax=Devosia sp. Root635 TaxID=1736575 RepID=UPI0006F22280|nr:tripartite tricarboxylate transporter TctB family protein [Devosia sp. Root635]KRA55919.1 hypothetical protein ASD80_01160 [Devosia sp. Root635]